MIQVFTKRSVRQEQYSIEEMFLWSQVLEEASLKEGLQWTRKLQQCTNIKISLKTQLGYKLTNGWTGGGTGGLIELLLQLEMQISCFLFLAP